jgi:CheY-like chemotaxis protein
MSQPLILIGRLDPNALEPMQIRLQTLGYTLAVAGSSDEALQLIEQTPPKAIIVDIATPEMNGIQVCSVLTKKRDSTIPLIALNQGDNILRQSALAAGVDLVLDEPINWTDFQIWLAAPRALNGHALASGTLLGQTTEDTLGAANLLSHDLKSPISVIISSLEVLLAFQEEDGMMDSTQRLLKGALNAAYRQLNLVSTLVDLPRLELDCYELQLADVDLVQVIQAALEHEQYTLEIKGLNVIVNLPEAPLMVHADHELLGRALSSLVDSVMKFTVRTDELRISARLEGEQAVVEFTDNGRPIQPGFEKDIMTRGPQWERRQAGARTSVALGLPFVYAVAQAHQGDFTAASTGGGNTTTFTLTLPALKHAENSIDDRSSDG